MKKNKPRKISELKTWDIADNLDNEEVIGHYLSMVMADGDPSEIMEAIGDVARARSMTKVAKETGLTREGLYKALSKGSKPQFETIRKVLDALGCVLVVQPKPTLGH